MGRIFSISKPLIVLFVDGLGIAPESHVNSLSASKTPVLDRIWDYYPRTQLDIDPRRNQIWEKSEKFRSFGYKLMGTGREILPLAVRIANSLKTGNFYKNEILLQSIENAKRNFSNLHLIVPLNLESTISILENIFQVIGNESFSGNRVFLHLVLNPLFSIQTLRDNIQKMYEYSDMYGIGNISTIIGHEYFENTEDLHEIIDLYFFSTGKKYKSIEYAIELGAKKGSIEPSLIQNYDEIFPKIVENDSLIVLNNNEEYFEGFCRVLEKDIDSLDIPKNIYFASLTSIEQNFPKRSLFPFETINETFSSILSKNKFRQLKIGSKKTLEYLTRDLNGGIDMIYPGEDRIELFSVSSGEQYEALQEKTFDTVKEKVLRNYYDVIIVGIEGIYEYAKKGDFESVVERIESFDQILSEYEGFVRKTGGALIITSSSPSCEEMIEINEKNIEAGPNPVPFIVVDEKYIGKKMRSGRYTDFAPTLLGLLGIRRPVEMSGIDLIHT